MGGREGGNEGRRVREREGKREDHVSLAMFKGLAAKTTCTLYM